MKIEQTKELMHLPNGDDVEAICPVVLSVSRSTDIPAFYSKWFINRIRAGYTVWKNPFNQKKSYISFKNTKAIVFWSKNPEPLIPYLDELDSRKFNYYFQFTLNDYVKENLEPGVPPLQERIDTFIRLSDRLGKERVIWRYDPIIMLPNLTPRDILIRIWNISKLLAGKTSKLVFSFADINTYGKVQNNLIREGLCDENSVLKLEPSLEQMNEIADGLSKIQKAWKEKGWEFELSTCAEKIDLAKFGITHNRCIDAELMKKVFSSDESLLHYLKYGELPQQNQPKQLDMFAAFDEVHMKELTETELKDKGQRKECGCMISKDIGFYNTCPHGCVYCYANTSSASAKNNYKAINQEDMSVENIKFQKI